MRILALETTEAVGSVAAWSDGNLLVQLELEHQKRSAQSLAPALATLLDQVGWRAADVQLVAVTVGPGSFTGLRVGLTAAKTFAYAVAAEVLGVDTLETVAAGAPPEVCCVSAAVDAQRGEVVAQAFRRDGEGWFRPVAPAQLISADAWLGNLDEGVAVTGPALGKLTGRIPEGVRVLDPQYWPPTAVQVARLAERDYAAGRRDDLWSLLPHYSRPSAAEEKWKKRD